MAFYNEENNTIHDRDVLGSLELDGNNDPPSSPSPLPSAAHERTMPDRSARWAPVPYLIKTPIPTLTYKQIMELRHFHGFPFPGPTTKFDEPTAHNARVDYRSIHEAMALAHVIREKDEELFGEVMQELVKLYYDIDRDQKRDKASGPLLKLLELPFGRAVGDELIETWKRWANNEDNYETSLPDQAALVALVLARDERTFDGWIYWMLDDVLMDGFLWFSVDKPEWQRMEAMYEMDIDGEDDGTSDDGDKGKEVVRQGVEKMTIHGGAADSSSA